MIITEIHYFFSKIIRFQATFKDTVKFTCALDFKISSQRKNKNEWSSQTIRFYFRFQFPVLYFFSFYCARVLVQIQSLTHLDQIPVRDLCVSAKQLCQGHMITPCNLGKCISCLNYVITFCKPYAFGRSALRYCYQIITTSP